MELIKIYTDTDDSNIKHFMNILLENQIECYQKETTNRTPFNNFNPNPVQEKSIFVLPSDEKHAKELIFSSHSKIEKKNKKTIQAKAIKTNTSKKKKKAKTSCNKFGFMSYFFIFLFIILPLLVITISIFSSIINS